MVGRLVLLQGGNGIKFRWLRRLSAGGLTSTVPTSFTGLKRKLMIKVIGGPLASFLLFLVGPILLLFPESVNQSHILQILTLFSGYNLYLAFLNSLPIKVGYYSTDGHLISMLANNTPHGERFLAVYRYLAYLTQGVRPRDIDAGVIERAIAIPEPSMHHCSGLLMAYYHALDAENWDQAGAYLDQALELKQYAAEYFRAELLLEAAYFEAQVRKSPTLAKEWFSQVKELAFIQPFRYRHPLLKVILVGVFYPQLYLFVGG